MLAGPLVQRVRDAEVAHERVPGLGQQNVLGLEVAVDDALHVGVAQCRGHFPRDLHHMLDGQTRGIFVQAVPQRARRHVWHGIEEPACRDAGVEQRQEMGVVQSRLCPDLPQEPLDAERGAKRGMEHLEGDPTVVSEVASPIHRGSGAPAQLLFHQISVGQRDGQQVDSRLGHRVASSASRASSAL